MFMKKNASLGVDIGANTIKIVEMENSSRGPRIVNAGISEPLPDNSIETVTAALKELIDRKKFHFKGAISTVQTTSEKSATARRIFIEHSDMSIGKDELKEQVQWEAITRDFMPFPAEEAVIDCHVLGEATREDTPGIWVFFVAAHIDSIKERVNILREAGLVPLSLEIDFSATLGLLGYMNLFPEDEDVAIIDVGAAKTSVGIIYRGQLAFYRDISVAGNHITSQIERRLRIKREEAEDYKLTEELFELVSDGREDSWRAAAPIESVIEERQGLYPQIRECFRYYDGEVANAKLSKIFLLGGSSLMRGFNNLISHRLNIPVDSIDLLDSLPPVSGCDVSEIEGREPIFATAFGLALKPFRKSRANRSAKL